MQVCAVTPDDRRYDGQPEADAAGLVPRAGRAGKMAQNASAILRGNAMPVIADFKNRQGVSRHAVQCPRLGILLVS